MLKCSKEAFAACPDRKGCGCPEEATFTEGSECDMFNRQIGSQRRRAEMATEQRLIDANKVAQDVRENNKANFFQADWSSKRVCELLENAPTVDAVEVVRCKDCKHCCLDLSGRDAHLCMRKEVGFIVRRKLDDFCSYGERRTDNV